MTYRTATLAALLAALMTASPAFAQSTTEDADKKETTEADAKEFSMQAKLGSQVYGICSNQFLDQEFRTIQFDLTIKILGNDSFSYDEDTQLKIKGNPEIFHHTDKNIPNNPKDNRNPANENILMLHFLVDTHCYQ